MEYSKNNLSASLIVPTYNRKKLLGYTLESLTKQSIDPKSFEVIIVDDGSTDNTLEVVDQYRELLNITYFYQEDMGFRVSTARNVGLAAAASDVCILIDSGILLPSWGIEEHLKSHAQHLFPIAVIGYVYGVVNSSISNAELAELIDITDLDRSLQIIKEKPEHADLREEVFKKYKYSLKDLAAPWIFFWGGNVSFKKSVFTEGEFYFNEVFNSNWGCEDVEFGYRLHQKGVKIVLNPQASSFHYPHEKYKDFETAGKINIEKFNNIYNTLETRLLYKLTNEGINNIFLNDYLRSPIHKLNI